MRADGYLTAITDPAGNSHSFTYSGNGLLESFTDKRGNTSLYTYNDLGRLVGAKDAAGGAKSLARTETDNGYTTTFTTAENRTTSYLTEYLPTGEERRLNTSPDGTKNEVLIDTGGGRTITNTDGVITSLKEGPDPRFGMLAPAMKNLSTVTPQGLTSSISSERSANLADPNDPFSLISLAETTTVNGNAYTSLYDAATLQYTATSPEGRQTVNKLDPSGKVVEQRLGTLLPATYEYDVRGRIQRLFWGARNAQFSYDVSGNLASITDALNRTNSFEYDGLGRITRQILPDGRSVGFAYDAADNIVAVTPPGRPDHLFGFGPVNQMTEYDPPAVGSGVVNTLYSYNLDRQLTRVDRPDGASIRYNYGTTNGRLESILTPNGGQP